MIYSKPLITAAATNGVTNHTTMVFWDEENQREYEHNRVMGKLAGRDSYTGRGSPFIINVLFNGKAWGYNGTIFCGETGQFLANVTEMNPSYDYVLQKLKDVLLNEVVCAYPRVK